MASNRIYANEDEWVDDLIRRGVIRADVDRAAFLADTHALFGKWAPGWREKKAARKAKREAKQAVTLATFATTAPKD
jgi:hypothetical protein